MLAYIHKKTIVDEFKEVGETHIKPENLEKLIKDLTDERQIRRIVINALADFYFNLRSLLSEKQHDPVYRQILERLERLRLEWITRTINTKTFLARLRVLNEEVREYEKKISGKSDVERILETISHYIAQRTGNKVQLNNTKEVIEKVISRKMGIFTPEQRRIIRTAILRDLFLSNVDEKIAMSLAEELTEYIAEEVERKWKG